MARLQRLIHFRIDGRRRLLPNRAGGRGEPSNGVAATNADLYVRTPNYG